MATYNQLVQKLISGQKLTKAEYAQIGVTAPVEKIVPANDGGNNPPKTPVEPTGKPGAAWTWSGSQWVRPEKPAGDYTWDDTSGWVASKPVSNVVTTSNADKQATVTLAVDEFRNALSAAGLGALVTDLDNMIKNNSTPSEIKYAIRNTQSYKDRFPGMKALSEQGKAVTEGAYIDAERGMVETLHAYGVDPAVYGTREILGKAIGGLVSPREWEERVNDAAVRVEAQPDVLGALSLYHGVDKGTAIGYLLDPKLGMDLVRKQVRAAEIGAAAIASGFTQFNVQGEAGANYAESYVSQIGTEDLQTLKKEFGQAAILAQTQGRLASIEGQAYTSDQAIQAAVIGNQAAGLESQRRAAREAARFGGASSFITRESTAGNI
jgi:hypothetical protein